MNAHTVVAVLCLASISFGCDGNVSVDDDASGSEATGPGSGGSGNSGATGSQGGAGNAGASSSTASGGSGTASGGAGPCTGLFEANCLGANPICAPVYDDECCPTCDPGPCADCSNPEFHHCEVASDACTGMAPDCGSVPSWGCSGAPHICPMINDPSDTYQCDSTPGCVVAKCSPDVNCMETQCHAVTGDSCTALCDAVPPSCEPGMTAEADGGCWTGFCIPADVCGVF